MPVIGKFADTGKPLAKRTGYLQEFIRQTNAGKNPMINPQFAEKSPLAGTRIHQGYLNKAVTEAEYIDALAKQAGAPRFDIGGEARYDLKGIAPAEALKNYNAQTGATGMQGPRQTMGPYMPSDLPPAQPYGAPMRALNAGPQTQLLEQASAMGGPNQAIPMGRQYINPTVKLGSSEPYTGVKGFQPTPTPTPVDPLAVKPGFDFTKAELAKIGEEGFVSESIWGLPEGHPDRVAAGIAEAEKVAAAQTPAELSTLNLGKGQVASAAALDDTIGAAAKMFGPELPVAGGVTTAGLPAATPYGAVVTEAKFGTKAIQFMNSKLPGFMTEAGASISGASLLSGAGIAMTGLMASGMVDNMDIGGQNSFIDHMLTGGIQGGSLAYAGMAALSMAGAPVAIAVGIGVGLGAIANWAFGDHDSDDDKLRKTYDGTNKLINDMLANSTYNVDPDTASLIRQQVLSTMDILKQQKNLEGMKQYTSNLAATIPAEMLKGHERATTAANSRYMQQAFGPVLADSMQRSNQVADQSYMFGMQAAQKIANPAQRYEAVARLNQSRTASTNLVAAYAAQIAGPQAANMSPQGQAVLTAAQQNITP
jgi:hypothetical protein